MSSRPPLQLNLSRIAHDLRGPLMPLRTAAWLLRNEPGASAKVGELADIVDRQSVRLARMLDEISEWARITGPAKAEDAPIEVPMMVDLVLGGLAGPTLDARISEAAAAFPLRGDQGRLGLALRSLIEHAIARDPEGVPDVAIEVVAGRLHVHVRDHGVVLDADARDALLSRAQATPFDEGLGLRLLLAREIFEAHGGTLDVDTPADGGLALLGALPASG